MPRPLGVVFYLFNNKNFRKARVDFPKALKLILKETAIWKALPACDKSLTVFTQGNGYRTHLISLRANLFRQTNITRMSGDDFFELLRLSILEKLYKCNEALSPN